MITLNIHFNNRTEIRVMESLWAANLVAISIIRNNPSVNSIDVVNRLTGEITKTYQRA